MTHAGRSTCLLGNSLGQRLSLVQRSCLTVPQAERKSAHPSTVADHIPFDAALSAVESDCQAVSLHPWCFLW
jgi:hypothetical protein